MIKSTDVGSLPYTDKPNKLSEAAKDFTADADNNSAKFFEQIIVNAFLDKLKADVSVPAFPQFRDMSEMFLSAFDGLEKIRGGYIETGNLDLKRGQGELPEVAAIEKNAKEIHTQTGTQFSLRVCITGPYTLASFFPHRNSQTYTQLGHALSEIVEKNLFATNHGKVTLLSIDEPLFGVIDDPSMDRAIAGRENLLAAWESIAGKARARSVETCIHLHNTSDDLFWAVKSLRIIESHKDDPIYEMKTVKQRLEKEDKMLKASIAITDFDRLMKNSLGLAVSEEVVADVWKNISKGKLNPEKFLEASDVIKKRLLKITERFGSERVALAGPECGLRGFPTYASAIECLKRVSKAVK